MSRNITVATYVYFYYFRSQSYMFKNNILYDVLKQMKAMSTRRFGYAQKKDKLFIVHL